MNHPRWKVGTSANTSLGTVTIQFGTTSTATMTLPNGTQVPLTRFNF